MNRRTLLRAIVAQAALGPKPLAPLRASEPMTSVPPIHLQAASRDGKLVLEYGVENPIDDRPLSWNTSHRRGPDLRIGRRRVFRDGGLVTVYRVPNVRMPSLVTPLMTLMTLVRAGTRFGEALELGLPLREIHPYDPPSPSPCREQASTYRGLRFSIGYIGLFRASGRSASKLAMAMWISPYSRGGERCRAAAGSAPFFRWPLPSSNARRHEAACSKRGDHGSKGCSVGPSAGGKVSGGSAGRPALLPSSPSPFSRPSPTPRVSPATHRPAPASS